MTFLARHVCLCLPAKKSACALKRKQIFTEQAVYGYTHYVGLKIRKNVKFLQFLHFFHSPLFRPLLNVAGIR